MIELLDSERMAKYQGKMGLFCPFCESNDLDWDSPRTLDGDVIQEVSCLDCGKAWIDVYTLTRVEVI